MRKVANSTVVDQGPLIDEWQWSNGGRWGWDLNIWKSGEPANDDNISDKIYVRWSSSYQFFTTATFSSWLICQK